jgi:V8-like Glu-specific endopeptidase
MKNNRLLSIKPLSRLMILGLGLFGPVLGVQADVVSPKASSVVGYTVPASQAGEPDYLRAKPLPLPAADPKAAEAAGQDLLNALSGASLPSLGGAPVVSPGAMGNGKPAPVFLGLPTVDQGDGGVSSMEYGTQKHPFSTARADLAQGNSAIPTNQYYPYRASGKLFFQDGASSMICSASLIKRGVVLTAAHCVSKFGANRFYTNIRYVPGYRSNVAPYGTWAAQRVWVMRSYLDGSMPCAAGAQGVVCTGDIAVIELAPQLNAYPGTRTGWYGYGMNGWGFSQGLSIASSQVMTQITQIGYPGCLDNAQIMERNDSMGYRSSSNANNTIIGSLMCGGSSGGPWVANFGIRPTLTGQVNGTYANPNIAIGVTSWGYTNNTLKQQGASPFLSSNLGALMNSACANNNPRCQ